MFDQAFKNELLHISSDNSVISAMWAEIQSSYNKPTRYYHNIRHLDSLVEQLLPIRYHIKDWQTLIFSVAYHDFIYDTLRQDNEEKSAALAYERLTQLNLPASQKEKCKLQILATKQHRESYNPDTNYFIDADLSILGYDENSYHNYAELIRREYSLFPDEVYNSGRRKVLEGFFGMKNIFKTKYFQDKYEGQAKLNISNELKLLLG